MQPLEAQLIGEKQSQSSTIERLRAELSHATRDCQRYETLLGEGGVSEQERDRFCLVQETHREEFERGDRKPEFIH